MTPKLYKVAEVCEIARLQPYVLKSWEKEFPGIGLQKADDSGRLYRQSDVDQVLRIKQLVFGEGLTLAGARRRLEEAGPAAAAVQAAEVIEVLGADVRKRIGHVREELRSLLELLSKSGNGHEYRLTAPPDTVVKPPAVKSRAPVQRRKTTAARTKKGVSRGKPARAATKGRRART